MFSFFKQRIPARDVAEGYFESIRENAESENPNYPVPDKAPLGMEIVKDEWIYFKVFIFDYSTFLAFGETPKRHAILNPFSALITNWLTNRKAPAITESRIIAPTPDNISEPPKFIAEERSESSHERLKRRVLTYAEALKAPCSLGQDYMVALTFVTLCGVDFTDIPYIMSISANFSYLKIEQAKHLKSLRIS
jgi:hypothetical protein